MSEMRDLQRDKANILTVVETWSNGHGPTHLETIALHAIDRAIAAEKKLNSIMQAIHDFDPYGYSDPGYEKLIDWIASTCPWFEEEMK